MRRCLLLLGAGVLAALLGPSLQPGEATPTTLDDSARLDELAAEVRRLKNTVAELEVENARLADELARVHGERAARELAWYEYNRALAELKIDDKVPAFPVDEAFVPETDEEPEEDASPQAELARQLAKRSREILISLRHFLLVEEIRGIDLLEVGSLDRGAIGPAVFRLLDDKGRLSGGLSAERLRLEASRAGHLVTLVLENGFESRRGERVPFTGGVRRIVLPYVDPEPWIESFPELFPASQIAPPLDDGRFELQSLAREVTALMGDAAEAGGVRWRLDRIGGVRGDSLMMVQLESLNDAGLVDRRVFADRMRIECEGDSIRIRLDGGVVERRRSRTPFVDGSYRIYLPRADAKQWAAAGLPGLKAPADDQR